MFLGVTGTSPSQVASILKEKTAFLQKHDEVLFEKDFRDYLSESLKAKKQSIEAIAEVNKTMNRKRPFRRVPHFLMEGQTGGGGEGQKTRSSNDGKYNLFQKKGTSSQQQPNFTSNHDKHGRINSSSTDSLKNHFPNKKFQNVP